MNTVYLYCEKSEWVSHPIRIRRIDGKMRKLSMQNVQMRKINNTKRSDGGNKKEAKNQ